jgi:hypothetical protein
VLGVHELEDEVVQSQEVIEHGNGLRIVGVDEASTNYVVSLYIDEEFLEDVKAVYLVTNE